VETVAEVVEGMEAFEFGRLVSCCFEDEMFYHLKVRLPRLPFILMKTTHICF
jgi:hypothetical protein